MSWEPGKPSQNEDEYFARQDEEWKKARRAELDAQRAARDAAAKRMQCPRCDGHLVEREFHRVKVDGETPALRHTSAIEMPFARAAASIAAGVNGSAITRSSDPPVGLRNRRGLSQSIPGLSDRRRV